MSASTTCRCLVLQTDDFELRIGDWRLDETSRATFQRIEATTRKTERTYYVDSATLSGDELTVDTFAIVTRDAFMRGERGEFDGTSVALESVRWTRTSASPRVESNRSCPPSPDALDSPRGGLRARSLRFDGEAWQVREARTTGLVPLGLGDMRLSQSRAASGPMPPRMLYTDETLEVQGSYLWGTGQFGPIATIAPSRWYGGGVQIASRGAQADALAPRYEHPTRLDLQMYGTSDGDLAYDLVGDGYRGGRYGPGAVSLEETDRDALWRLDRLRDPGMFRGWRSSRGGLSLNGPRHHLQIDVRHLAPTDRSPESFDELAGGRLRYGADHDVAEGVRASTELVHRSLVRSEGEDRYGTGLFGALAARLGDRTGWYLEGEVANHSGHRLVAVDGGRQNGDGLQSRATLQLLGAVRGGVGLEGRFASWRHRLEPRVTLLREIAGTGGQHDAALSRGAPYRRVPQWTAAVVTLAQQFHVDAFDIALPLGILQQAPGFDAWLVRSPTLFGRLGMGTEHWRLRGRAVQRVDESPPAVTGGPSLRWRSLGVGYRLGTLSPPASTLAYADDLSSRGPRAIRRLEPNTGASLRGTPLQQSLDVRLHVRPVTVRWEGWLETDGSAGGTWMSVSRSFPELGWALGVGGRLSTQPVEWGGFVGLSSSRRFPPSTSSAR